jgi:peptidoglycan/LPS O-acetylase OafA/YrhL
MQSTASRRTPFTRIETHKSTCFYNCAKIIHHKPDRTEIFGLVMEKIKDAFIEQWRGIAVFIVVYFHYSDRLPPDAFGFTSGPSIQQHVGKLGVLLFFIISGYLIAKSLEASKTLADFYAKRISRIWPLFILANLTVFVFLQFFSPPTVTTGSYQFYEKSRDFMDLLGTMFFAADLGFDWIDGAFWSLLVELKFYFFIGMCAVLFPKRFATAFCLFALALSGLDFLILYFDRSGPIGFSDSEQFRVVSQILHGLFVSQYMPMFAIGVALYRKKFDGLFTAVIFMACITALIGVYEIQLFKAEDNVLFLLAFAFLVVADHVIFKNAVFMWIGKYSYSIYLFHQMIGLTIMKLVAPYVSMDAAIVIALLSVSAIAWGASWLCEWRFRKLFIANLIKLFSLVGLHKLRINIVPTDAPAPEKEAKTIPAPLAGVVGK